MLLSGCQATTSVYSDQVSYKQTVPSTHPLTLEHLYSRIVVDSKSQQPINLIDLATKLEDKDVIFIGEFHANQSAHLFQMELLHALYQKRSEQVLSMEMFERDQQTILNRYLDGEIGEKYLINEAPTWPNYSGSYRPMIEFAKEHFIPVIAANAPGDIVRCIGEYGEEYINRLPTEQRGFVAKNAFLNDQTYQKKFDQFMTQMRHGKMDEERIAASYAAQLIRDNTMAESILDALNTNPNAQVVHLNGSFHSAQHLGTVAMLKQRRPDLNIAVITPIRAQTPQKPNWTKEDLKQGDFIYLLRPQPEEYVDASYRRQAMQQMFKTSKAKTQRCYQ